jgi:hypothetical protein
MMRIWKGSKTGIQMLTLPFVSMVLICLHLPLHELLISWLLPEGTAGPGMEAVNPLLEASVEGKQRKRKSQESESLPRTPYKAFIESKEKEKASKTKEMAEQQLKTLEAAQRNKNQEV